MSRSERMRFAHASLERLDCPVCKEVTLHKSGECIHCHHKLYELRPSPGAAPLKTLKELEHIRKGFK